jgi:hypothetical protein
MEDDIPEDITTSSGPADDLKPDSSQPWESSPDDSEPTITVELPEEVEVTEVKLDEPENVEDYTVIVEDEDGTTTTV